MRRRFFIQTSDRFYSFLPYLNLYFCRFSQFCKANCTHSIFRTTEARASFAQQIVDYNIARVLALCKSYARPCVNKGCVPLGWSRSGSAIRDHSDHCRSNEPKNPCPEWIHRFIWSTIIRGISDHWSWSGSSKKISFTMTSSAVFFVSFPKY